MTSSNIRGSCLCGVVTFEVSSPYHIMTHCHCSRCRKSTGTGHSTNIAANPESIRWLSGYESITRFELPGSERFGKWFCSHCGGPLPRVTQDGKMFVIPAGSLDTPPRFHRLTTYSGAHGNLGVVPAADFPHTKSYRSYGSKYAQQGASPDRFYRWRGKSSLRNLRLLRW